MNDHDQDRQNRGLQQKFYLINLERNQSKWSIDLKGLTDTYRISLTPQKLICNCPDYNVRGNFCKHLYFVILKIAGCYQIILYHDINQEKKINQKDFEQLDNNLILKILKYQKNNLDDDDKSSKKRRIIHECIICFDEIKENQEESECISQCHKHFHKDCLQKWFRINKNCPHCRTVSSFQNLGYETTPRYDPWNKLETLKIDLFEKKEENQLLEIEPGYQSEEQLEEDQTQSLEIDPEVIVID